MNPQIPIPQGSQIWYFPQKKSLFSESDDVLSAAERYMEEHGTEAFERLINKVHILLMLLVQNNWSCFKVMIFLVVFWTIACYTESAYYPLFNSKYATFIYERKSDLWTITD